MVLMCVSNDQQVDLMWSLTLKDLVQLFRNGWVSLFAHIVAGMSAIDHHRRPGELTDQRICILFRPDIE